MEQSLRRLVYGLLLVLTLALGTTQGQQTAPQTAPLYVASPNGGNGGGG
jgi:hypothetical protein